MISKNKVYLIGAGIGLINLMNIKSLKILLKANIILYDSLILNEILNFSPNAKKIFVGKRKKEKYITQNIINEYLIYFSFKFNFIIRLKCGDPMIFSRIDEELFILEKYKISYKIIPGITTALIAASSSRRPLTKRNISRSVSFFTTTFKKKNYKKNIFFNNNCTLIQYMGSKDIKRTIKKLLSIGYKKNTPIIIIENCNYKNESIFYLQLKNLKNNIYNFLGPVIIMIGESLKNF